MTQRSIHMAHVWVPSTLGHGTMMCAYCSATYEEMAATDSLHKCDAVLPTPGDNPTQDELGNLFVLAVYAWRAERDYRAARERLLDRYKGKPINMTGPIFAISVEPREEGVGMTVRMRKKVGGGWVSPAEYDGQVTYPASERRKIVRDGDAD
jgi:hypothetical protein